MTKKDLSLFLLGFVVLLAGSIRLWQLGNDGHPLLWDEAALGYNAYSIVKTGKDEYGTRLPLILKSFGDYKPGLYAYAAIPSVLKFGLSELAVRLPSALAGILIIVCLYFIAEELFPRRGFTVKGGYFPLGIFVATLAAVNPWLIHFSRGGWEANLNLFLTLGGVWAFLKSRKRPPLLLLSALFFGLTLLTYQSAKLFTPLILLGLAIGWGSEVVRKSRNICWLAVLIFIVFAFPIIISAVGSSGRLTVMSVFSYSRSASDTQEIASQEGIPANSFLFTLFHGQWFASLTGVLERYFNHFSGRFLFYEGDWDNGRLGSPYVGQFYWLDLVLLVVGMVVLARSKEPRSAVFLLYWIVISPLPAALSRDIVQAVRAFNLAVPLIILAGLGLVTLVNSLKRIPILVALVLAGIFLVGYTWNVAYYLDSYFVHAPIIQDTDWLYGYKEVVQELAQLNTSDQPVIFTQKLGQPYIYVLFYDKIDPVSYQAQAHLIENLNGDVGEVDRFANFRFRNIYWPEDRKLPHTFFVGTIDELPSKDIDPKQAKIVKDIIKPDGSVAFRIVKTN